MDSFWQDAMKIILTSLFMVTLYCLFIIIGSRYGWFLWLFKKILQLRSKYKQHKRRMSADVPQEEESS